MFENKVTYYIFIDLTLLVAAEVVKQLKWQAINTHVHFLIIYFLLKCMFSCVFGQSSNN